MSSRGCQPRMAPDPLPGSLEAEQPDIRTRFLRWPAKTPVLKIGVAQCWPMARVRVSIVFESGARIGPGKAKLLAAPQADQPSRYQSPAGHSVVRCARCRAATDVRGAVDPPRARFVLLAGTAQPTRVALPIVRGRGGTQCDRKNLRRAPPA